MRKIAEFRRKLWADPVWSAVIAGLILAAITGIVLASYGPARQRISDWIARRQTPIPSQEDVGYRNMVIPQCDSSRDPRKLYELARDLPTQEGREDAISDLVGDAVCIKDEQLALELFVKLTLQRSKDHAAKLAIAIHLDRKGYTEAQKWTALLSDARDREWWLERIRRDSRRSRWLPDTLPRS